MSDSAGQFNKRLCHPPPFKTRQGSEGDQSQHKTRLLAAVRKAWGAEPKESGSDGLDNFVLAHSEFNLECEKNLWQKNKKARYSEACIPKKKKKKSICRRQRQEDPHKPQTQPAVPSPKNKLTKGLGRWLSE